MQVVADQRPGLNPHRLADLVHDAVERCRLDLSGATVLTEAATGAYVVTPILAAAAGASVYALARDSRYGRAEAVISGTKALAEITGVSARLNYISEKTPAIVATADIVTNSGFVRPLDASVVEMMKPGSIIPLMYEDWEFRESDIDLAACRRRGVRVTGTNERHDDVDVFGFLGVMAVKLLLDAGVAPYRSNVVVLCANPFEPFIVRGLEAAGAAVQVGTSLVDVRASRVDAVLVARQPAAGDVLSPEELDAAATRWPGAVIGVYWGDVDRAQLRQLGLNAWPEAAPSAGHMGILPSAVGPEAIVRLQSGSLKAAEALWRHGADPSHPDHAYGQPL